MRLPPIMLSVSASDCEVSPTALGDSGRHAGAPGQRQRPGGQGQPVTMAGKIMPTVPSSSSLLQQSEESSHAPPSVSEVAGSLPIVLSVSASDCDSSPATFGFIASVPSTGNAGSSGAGLAQPCQGATHTANSTAAKQSGPDMGNSSSRRSDEKASLAAALS